MVSGFSCALGTSSCFLSVSAFYHKEAAEPPPIPTSALQGGCVLIMVSGTSEFLSIVLNAEGLAVCWVGRAEGCAVHAS